MLYNVQLLKYAGVDGVVAYGVISAVLSVCRTLVFQMTFILLLPVLLGSNGIWIASPSAELGCLILTVICLLVLRKKYHYLKIRLRDCRGREGNFNCRSGSFL